MNQIKKHTRPVKKIFINGIKVVYSAPRSGEPPCKILLGDHRLLAGVQDQLKKLGLHYDGYWESGSDMSSKDISKVEKLLKSIKDPHKEYKKKGWFVSFPYNSKLVSLAKSLNGIWDAEEKLWFFTNAKEADKMKAFIDDENLDKYKKKGWFVSFPYNPKLVSLAKSLNGTWNAEEKLWIFTNAKEADKMKDLVVQHGTPEQTKKDIQDEIAYAISEGWHYKFPYAHRDIPKRHHGFWAPNIKSWVFLNEDDKAHAVIDYMRVRKK